MSGSHNSHARLSPSSSKRWLSCTASTGFILSNIDRIPVERSSPHAEEGTLAHDYAEAVLLGKLTLDEVPEDFRPHVGFYVEQCLAAAGTEAETMVEVRVPLFYSEGEKGTADFFAIRPDRVINRDLKYGKGVPVEAEWNSQLTIYTWSVITDLEATGLYEFPGDFIVDIGIIQPRYHGEDPVKTWEVTKDELAEFAGEIGRTARLILDDPHSEDLVFAPSEDACRWCPAKGFCPARAAALDAPALEGIPAADLLACLPDLSKPQAKLPVEDRVGLRAADLTAPVTDDLLVQIHARAKAIRSWLEDIEEYLTERALAGDAAPGTKLVQGRAGNRKWEDEEAAEKMLKRFLKAEERYTRKLITPAQAEEALNLRERPATFRHRFDEMTGRSEGRPVLALESDKRPAVQSLVDDLPSLVDDLPSM